MATYTLEQNGRTCRVTLQGDLIAAVLPDLQAALKQQLAQGVDEVLFDLAATVMLDSSGIGLPSLATERLEASTAARSSG